MSDPSDTLLIQQKLDALKQRDEDARQAIASLCRRIAVLEQSSELHHLSISHCAHCKTELHRKTPFES